MQPHQSSAYMQGQMFADNGTISGGGTSVRTGKMRVGNAPPVARDPAVLHAELDAAEARAAAAEHALSTAHDTVTRAAAEASAAQQAAAAGGLALRKGELDVKSDAAKRTELEQQLATLRGKAQARNPAQKTSVFSLVQLVSLTQRGAKRASACSPREALRMLICDRSRLRQHGNKLVPVRRHQERARRRSRRWRRALQRKMRSWRPWRHSRRVPRRR